MTRFSIFFIPLLLLQLSLLPQSDPPIIPDDALLENLIDEPAEFDPDIIERINDLESNPFNLNTVDLNSLLSLPFFDLASANALLLHREKYGRFFSVDELNSVNGINKVTADLIRRFFVVVNDFPVPPNTPKSPHKIKKTDNFFLRLRQQSIPFSSDDNYIPLIGTSGEKLKSFLRSTYSSDQLFANILLEKDRDEFNFADFLSGNLSFKSESFIKQICIGDYYIQFGHGLLFWTPYKIPKGISVSNPVLRKARGIIPSKSSEENRFLRGAALNINYKSLSFNPFFSHNLIDAAVSENGFVTSLPADGYHRTENEIAKKDKLKESIFGSLLKLNLYDNLITGFCIAASHYDKPLSVESIRNMSLINNISHYSFYYDYFHPGFQKLTGFNLSGEISCDGTSVSHINSFQAELSKGFLLVFSARNYSENYYSIHASSFGERTLNGNNESGCYAALSFSSNFGKFTLYFDKYILKENENGAEFFVDFASKLSQNAYFNVRLKYETKELLDHNLYQKIYSEIQKGSLRTELILKPFKNWRFKSRIEFNQLFEKESDISETGFLIFQDVSFSPCQILDSEISFSARITFFSSPSFNSGFYLFENDLPGTMTIKQLNGEGLRWYLLLKSDIHSNIILSLKYAETYKALSNNSSDIRKFDSSFGFQFDVNF